MGFLDGDINLQGTPFNQDDLEYARGYWQFLIEKVAPEWLDAPQGHLAIHWLSDTVPSFVYLIDLAKMLYSLVHTITIASQPRFGGKLRQLLFSDKIQYEEQLTELFIGTLLSGLGTEVRMEPASTPASPQGTTPGTVDYGVDWADGATVSVESTVFHIQQLLDWESAVADLKRRFEKAMILQSLNRALRIRAPLELTHKTISAQALKKALRLIAENARGRQSIKLTKEFLDLEWAPVPHLEAFTAGTIPPAGFVFTAGDIEIVMLAATDVVLKWPGGAEELVNKSLRNTLNGKRRQFQLESPYLLVMRLTSDEIPLTGVLDLLERRIYKNVRYKWLSAVGILKVSFSESTGHRLRTSFVPNLNASDPLPDSFVAALTR